MGFLVAAFAVGGCSAEPEPRPTRTAEPPVTSASPEATSGATYLQWENLRVWRATGPTVDAVAGSELVVSSPLGPEIGHVAEVTTIDGKPRLTHRIGGDTWISQHHWIDDDLLGFLDASEDEHRARLTLMRPNGEQLPELPRLEDLNPVADLSHGRVGYLTGDPEQSMCVYVIEPLASNEIAWWHCGRTGVMLGDIALFEDRLSYTTVTDWTSPRERCKRVVFVDLVTGQTMEAETDAANQVADCHAWSGMPFHGGVAFDVTDPYSGDVGQSDVYVIPTGREVVEAGRALTDTIQGCGAGLFWTKAERLIRVMAWSVGGGTREVLEPMEGREVFSVVCAEERWISGLRASPRGRQETLIRADADTLT